MVGITCNISSGSIFTTKDSPEHIPKQTSLLGSCSLRGSRQEEKERGKETVWRHSATCAFLLPM